MKLKLEIITALLLFSVAGSYAQQVNFSGKWKLDTIKSDFGKVPHFVIFNQATIKQTKDSIELTSVTSRTDGTDAPAQTVVYATDGNPKENVINDTKIIGSFGYDADKKTMIKKQTFSSSTDPQQISKTRQDTWSLSADGKELTVKREFKSFNKQEASFTVVAVYDKQ